MTAMKDFIEEFRARRAAFVARVTDDMATRGMFRAALRRDGEHVTLTRSTRPGVALQVTHWVGGVPVGHVDVQSLDAAVRDIIGLGVAGGAS